MAGEHERLVKVFAGPVGLDPQEWPRVPRKLELVAQRNVQRADNAEKERCVAAMHSCHACLLPCFGFCAAGTQRAVWWAVSKLSHVAILLQSIEQTGIRVPMFRFPLPA